MHPSPQDLPRRLTAFNATTIIVGSIIGSGIFLSKAGAIAKLIPNPTLALMVWVVAGLLTLFGALSLAELGAMYPQSGGLYCYLREAYGPCTAFLFGWSMLTILESGSIAGIAAGVAQQAAGLQTGLGHASFTGREQVLLAGFLIVLLSVLNILSVRVGAEIQNVFTIAKSLGIVLLIFGGFVLANGSSAHFQAMPQPAQIGLASAFGLAMMKSLWAYDGWVNITYVTGEVQEPQRNLPRALLTGTVFVIIVYVLANAAYHWVLPLAEVQASENVASSLAQVVLGPAGLVTMAALVMVSAFGTLNSSVLSGPRVYYAMARDGLFFRQAASVHPRFQTPHVAIVAQCLCSLGLLHWWAKFEAITDNVVFVYWIFYALGAGAVIILRLRNPEMQRPYRTPGYPLVPLLFVAGALFLTINTMWREPVSSLQALTLLGVGVLVWPLFKRMGEKQAREAADDAGDPVLKI